MHCNALVVPGVRSQVRTLRKRNPWVRALLQLPVGAAHLKSEERRLRASQAVTAALRKATVDGVELAVDWAHHGSANKTHLTAFMKVKPRIQSSVLNTEVSPSGDQCRGQRR